MQSTSHWKARNSIRYNHPKQEVETFKLAQNHQFDQISAQFKLPKTQSIQTEKTEHQPDRFRSHHKQQSCRQSN